MSANKLLHILTTDMLGENDILVRFSDGTSAVYESEELEKLRPRQKGHTVERKVA